MDQGNGEPKRFSLTRIVQKFTGREVFSKPNADFEQALFKDGVYVFDFDKEVSRAEEDYASLKEWLQQPMWVTRAEGVLADMIGTEKWELAWKQTFSRQIPKDWDIWHGPYRAFENAKKFGVQLSPVLVNAGVSNAIVHVVKEAGLGQKLNPQQLGLIIGREDLNPFVMKNIIAAQFSKGMTKNQYSEAEKYGAAIREKIRKARDEKKKFPLPGIGPGK